MGKKSGTLRFREIKSKLKEVVTKDFEEFLKKFSSDVKLIQSLNQRRLVVLTGEDDVKLAGIAAEVTLRYVKKMRKLYGGKKRVKLLYVFHDEFPDARLRVSLIRKVLTREERFKIEATFTVYETSKKYLGTTFQVLIMDLVNDLKPNDVGRLLGIVEGGGIVILLTPPLAVWPQVRTIFKENLTTHKFREPRNIFIGWFIRKLREHKGIYVFDVDEGKLLQSGFHKVRRVERKEIKIPEKRLFDEKVYKVALTQDQVEVIKLIETHMVPKVKGKKVSIVITADRGRGKSSAIGIGIIGLITELLKFKNKVRVAVTASEPLGVQALMELAMKTADELGLKYKVIKRGGDIIEIKGNRFSIEYWQPYTVLRLDVDVVVVDEAAGIPVPLLHRIWSKFSRTIYATTIHGYEGAGRGFSVRFLRKLREDPKTKLILFEMEEPIRYSADDPIERFQFDVLLLDAEPEELSEEDIELIKRGEFTYEALSPEYLFSPEGEEDLRHLFGIYVLAHYRNEPDDLGRIADAPHHSVRVARLSNGKIVGAVQLAEEGDIPDDLIDELLVGGKIPGNIIPDRLLKHLRRREFGRGSGWRIVRIAVHLDVQGRGIGSYLLSKVVEEAARRGLDWVGAGFGVSSELLNFWLKNGFKVLHLSPDRNPVSGEYTALVIKPLNSKWEELVNEASREFSLKVVDSLHAVYRDLEPDIAMLLLRDVCNREIADRLELTDTQLDRLKVYVRGVMTFESVCDAVTSILKKLILSGLTKELNYEELMVAVMRVFQGRGWDTIYDELRLGKAKTTNLLRAAVAKALKTLYGIEVELPAGP